MRTILQDLRFGLRLLWANPGFTAVAVLTLALGIASTATVFARVDGLLLHPFPGATNSERLAVLEMITAGAPNGAVGTSYVEYRDYRNNLKSISGLAVHWEDVFSLGEGTGMQPVWGELVSGNYFAVLGVKPALGRMFAPEEDGNQPGAYPVAVISHRLWLNRFHADPGVVGRTLPVNRHQLTVVGVAPAEFRGTMPGMLFDIWIPVTMGKELRLLDESAFRQRDFRCLYALARLRPGVAIEQARVETATLARSLEAAYPDTNRGVSATVLPVWEVHQGPPDLLLGPLRILMAVSILVLLIVCANVANLLLARTIARRKELSLRLALGAGPGRLIRQLLTETLLLTGAGALAGLPLASWMGSSLPGLIPKIGFSVAPGFQLNVRILAFTILTCVLAALVSCAAPALIWLRCDVNQALKEGGGGAGHGGHSHRARSLLVVSEVALATLVLIGAGLFARSFRNAKAMDPGFDKHNVILARFHLAGAGFSTLEMQQFCFRLREALRSAPGISDVSYADWAPLGSGVGFYDEAKAEGYAPVRGESMQISRDLVAPGYFRTLRIPVLEGRDFRDGDDWEAKPVMIVNQSFVRRYFHGTSPVGRRVKYWGKWFTVIGLVKDSKHFSVMEPPQPHFFAPFRQQAGADGQLYFFLKAAGDPATATAGLRRAVAALDPNAGAFDAMPIEEWMGVPLLPQKVAASLMAALGLISLLLAGVGLYSVMAYAVTERTREIGIRMAVGARPRDVLGDVLLRGMALTGVGMAVGIAAALAATRLVASLLVEVNADDPATFAGAAVFLVSVAFVATCLPARRATHVDPMVALRYE